MIAAMADKRLIEDLKAVQTFLHQRQKTMKSQGFEEMVEKQFKLFNEKLQKTKLSWEGITRVNAIVQEGPWGQCRMEQLSTTLAECAESPAQGRKAGSSARKSTGPLIALTNGEEDIEPADQADPVITTPSPKIKKPQVTTPGAEVFDDVKAFQDAKEVRTQTRAMKRPAAQTPPPPKATPKAKVDKAVSCKQQDEKAAWERALDLIESASKGS
eukprot:s119_g72.t1